MVAAGYIYFKNVSTNNLRFSIKHMYHYTLSFAVYITKDIFLNKVGAWSKAIEHCIEVCMHYVTPK